MSENTNYSIAYNHGWLEACEKKEWGDPGAVRITDEEMFINTRKQMQQCRIVNDDGETVPWIPTDDEVQIAMDNMREIVTINDPVEFAMWMMSQGWAEGEGK